jgi:hypothetical protein
MKNSARLSTSQSAIFHGVLAATFLLAGLTAGTPRAEAGQTDSNCSQTSRLMRKACNAELRDDYLVEFGKCLNEATKRDQRRCERRVQQTVADSQAECADQFEVRQDVCRAVGQAPYDPSFLSDDFDTDLATLTTPNPLFPLSVGYHWMLSDGAETIDIEVLDETKLISGVTCFVIRDTVSVNGELVEDTNDWFAHAKDGAVWYCGEEVKDYESFDGDLPKLAELISIDGSFKVGRDGARPGVSFPALPEVGSVYRQEFSLGNAEDVAEILATDYSYGTNPELDLLVPEALADMLCNNDCVVVLEYSPLDPGALGRKYYAPGIGFFLETAPEEGIAVQLIGCNFDSRCNHLPGL